MFNEIVLILIGITALSNNSINRYSIACFMWLCFIVSIVESFIPDKIFNIYYLLSAATDAAIIFFLSRINNVTKDVADVQKVCLAFIYLNLFGFITYELYISTIYYNYLCSVAYIALLILLIKGTLNHVRILDKLRSFVSSIHINHRRISLQLQINENKA